MKPIVLTAACGGVMVGVSAMFILYYSAMSNRPFLLGCSIVDLLVGAGIIASAWLTEQATLRAESEMGTKNDRNADTSST